MDNRTEKLADGLWRIEVGPYINVFLVANDGRDDREGLTLVDTGLRRSGPRIVASIRDLGLDPTAVGDVLLSHWHPDHTGSAARLAASSANPRLWAGQADLAVIAGQHRPRDQIQVREDTTRVGRMYVRVMRGGPAVEASPLRDGDCPIPGVRVVATPGHTAGHISLHLAERGALLAGDAVFNILFASRGLRMVATRLSQERQSLEKLAALDFDLLAPSHGPPLTKAPHEVLRRLAARAMAA